MFLENERERISREKWYRVEEFEKRKYTASLSIDTHVTFNRYVIRAGYYYQPKDMPEEEEIEAAKNILFNRVKPYEAISMATIERILRALDNYDDDGSGALKHLRYVARGEWLSKMNFCNENTRLRTLWFMDIDWAEGLAGIITRKKAVWIGKYYPANGWYDDYEPGGLINPVYQQLYQVSTVFGEKLVHPLDVKEMKPGDEKG